jgi:Matrixin
MKRACVWLLASTLLTAAPTPAAAYLKFAVQAGGSVVDIKWRRPVQYFVSDRPGPGVSAADMRDAIGRAFATWQRVPSTTLQSQFQGFTTLLPNDIDGRTTFGFLDRPELDRVLGATSLMLDSTTGEIIEADVFFNSGFNWSTAANGETGRVDLESVALHEIGHLLGLGHSALGETELVAGGRRVIASGTVMFPIALAAGAIADRQLQPDDIAAIADLYARDGLEGSLSSINGRVTKNGVGIFGAHVVAFNLETAILVGGFSLNSQGDFVIGGLSPGTYLLRAEPLDDADTGMFFAGVVDVDFRIAYSTRVLIAPVGGSSERIELQVKAK